MVWAWIVAAFVIGVDVGTIADAGAWDPWETHYGEVARQILVRSDPMDLWWQPGNGGPDGESEKSFASKPVLSFWLMALSMKVTGVGTSADPAELVRPFLPEFALRLPSMLAGWSAAVVIGFTAWRLATPRAGVLAAAIVSTMPQYAIVTRQALTDMIFVAPVVAAACAWALAWLQPERELRTRGQRWRTVPWDRAYVVFLVVLVVGAVVPLAVLHQHAFDPLTWKYFGKIARRAEGLRAIQQHLIVYWVALAVVLVASLRWRRRSQPLMGILYVCAGLSLLAKGFIGPGIIGVIVLVHLLASGRWNLLLRCGLPTGVLIFVATSFPWHHAMALYRGERWVAELIIENNLRRFATGEQKQAVGGFSFYIETLGIAALPWSAVLPTAAYAGVRSFLRPEDERGVALQRFATLWLAVALFAITYSTTKYYHYVLPCLPPAALVTALWLDRAAEMRERSRGTWIMVGLGLALLAVVVRDAGHMATWLAHLTTYLYTGMWTEGAPAVDTLALTCAPFAIGLLAWPWIDRRWCLVAMLAAGIATHGWIIGRYVPGASESWSQRSAMRMYFEGREPGDRLVSWWFYYRGETWFAKGDMWVMKEPDRNSLGELVEQSRGQGKTLWFITTVQHANRLATNLPADMRDRVEPVYENFHYALLRATVP